MLSRILKNFTGEWYSILSSETPMIISETTASYYREKGGNFPAYDINPTLQENQSLLINRSTNESDLNILLMSADDYMLSKDKAEKILSEVEVAMKSWQTEARRLGIPQRDIDTFAPRINKWL